MWVFCSDISMELLSIFHIDSTSHVPPSHCSKAQDSFAQAKNFIIWPSNYSLLIFRRSRAGSIQGNRIDLWSSRRRVCGNDPRASRRTSQVLGNFNQETCPISWLWEIARVSGLLFFHPLRSTEPDNRSIPFRSRRSLRCISTYCGVV